jgi:hypothetical protein
MSTNHDKRSNDGRADRWVTVGFEVLGLSSPEPFMETEVTEDSLICGAERTRRVIHGEREREREREESLPTGRER